jgi:SAM-dependent methyltransferase
MEDEIGTEGVFEWFQRELQPRVCTSEEFIYDDVDSQSGRSLPIIYQPFDAGQMAHWRDRGALFDFLFSTEGEGKKILDFGPGDGWPSLIIAPHVAEVVGVEGSRRRVEVCGENAARLGVSNATFTYVAPGTILPFEEGTFDAVVAASSVEQTPDPKATLRELFRVLRPGGRLRIRYEALRGYRGLQERSVWLARIDERKSALILFDRRIDEERTVQYGLVCAIRASELRDLLSPGGTSLAFDAVTVARLEALRSALTDVRVCTTIHPSGRTLLTWLEEIGYRHAIPTHDGIWVAGRVFEQISEERRPSDLEAVDEYLRPIVKVAVTMPAPVSTDPMITAVK